MKKSMKIPFGSNDSDSETDVQSFISQPFPNQPTSIPDFSPRGNNDAIPVVDFTSADMARLQAQHGLSLFAKVLGKRVAFHRLASHLRRVLPVEGNLEIIPLENEFFLLKFSNDSDFNKAIQGVPWMIDYHYITLHRWSPNFKASEAIITQAAVWIRLPELPVEYYDPEALRKIPAVVGRLVKIDPVTESRLKCKFARFCVELDLHKPLPNYVKLPNGVWQPIQYEGLHVRCHECRRVGHFQENCSFRSSTSTSTSPPTEQCASHDPPCSDSSVNNPWSQVPLRRQNRSEFTRNSGDTTRTRYSASGSRFQVLTDNTTELGVNSEIDQEYLKSYTLRNIRTSTRNKLASASSTKQPGKEESVKVDTEAPSRPQIFDTYFSSTTAPPTLQQVVPTPQIPVTSPRIRMYTQVVQRGAETREINIAPVEIKERSTEGCPTVFDIDSKVSELAIDVEISPLSNGSGNLHHITISPTMIDHTTYAIRTSSTKKILTWNCRGASDPSRIRAMEDLCEAHDPSILILLETRTSGIDANRVITDLGFSNSYCIDPVGYTGGVWLLWRKEHINLNISSCGPYQIHAVAEFSQTEGYEPLEWYIYGVDSDEN